MYPAVHSTAFLTELRLTTTVSHVHRTAEEAEPVGSAVHLDVVDLGPATATRESEGRPRLILFVQVAARKLDPNVAQSTTRRAGASRRAATVVRARSRRAVP